MKKFNLKSGNTSPFKEMGSSPAKQGIPTPEKLTPEEERQKILNRDKHKPGPWDHSGIPTPLTPEEREKQRQQHEKNPPGPWDHSGIPNPPKNEDEPIRPKKKSPAKQVGSTAQDRAVDKLATRTDLSKVQFEKKLAKITKTVDPYPDPEPRRTAKSHVKKGPKSKMPKDFNIKGDPSTTPGRAETKIAKAAKGHKVGTFNKRDVRFIKRQPGKFVKHKMIEKPLSGHLISKGADKAIKTVGKTAGKAISKLAGPVGAGLMAYDVLKEGVKRVAKGVKTGVPQTKLKGKNIKDTFKRVPKKKYTK